MRLQPAAVAVAIAASGCYSTYLSRPGTLPPAVKSVSAEERVAAWNKAIAVLLADGWVPQVMNEGACYVGARRRDDLADDTLLGALASVQVDPAGTIVVQVAGAGRFRSQQDLDAALKAAQDEILAGILGAPRQPLDVLDDARGGRAKSLVEQYATCPIGSFGFSCLRGGARSFCESGIGEDHGLALRLRQLGPPRPASFHAPSESTASISAVPAHGRARRAPAPTRSCLRPAPPARAG